MPDPTHIVLTYPSQDTEIMFRASDGVMIAERQKCTLIFGENPAAAANDPKRKQSRVFIEGGSIFSNGQNWDWNEFGSRYMRTVVAKADNHANGLYEGVTSKTGPVTMPDSFLDGASPVIEERCQEGSVILAPDSLDMRSNGGGMPAIHTRKLN